MLSIFKARHHVVVLVLALGVQAVGAVLSPEEATDLMATRLDQEQMKEGLDQGVWLSEELFMGPLTAGMVSAYEWTGDSTYQAAAELAGGYILWMGASTGNLLGDEAYALMRLSIASEDQQENPWRTALQEFYESPRRELTEGTTEEYIAFFGEMDSSTAVFYLAHHAIAANYVDDLDKNIWRDALIRYLSRVDDNASFPVTALAAATWALATTGPLDDTPIARDYEAWAGWDEVTLSDLPALLLGHQVPAGELFGGSFYWRFDHSGGPEGGVAAGYTEDTIFGLLGLVAAAAQDSNLPVEERADAIEAAQEVLLSGIDEEGYVHAHLSQLGQAYHAFAGEMLQALWAAQQYQDRRTDPALEGSEPVTKEE